MVASVHIPTLGLLEAAAARAGLTGLDVPLMGTVAASTHQQACLGA